MLVIAFAARDDDVVGRECRGRGLQAAHHQNRLRRQAERIGVEPQHLEVVDAVQGGIPQHRRPALLIAASVDHRVPLFTNVCTCVTSLFSSEYDTVTVSTASFATATTDCTVMY